jgi:hypothetical protein
MALYCAFRTILSFDCSRTWFYLLWFVSFVLHEIIEMRGGTSKMMLYPRNSINLNLRSF